ncbi:uncharacterized protein C2orf78-like [Ochotona princeps]|uniref:uncharacterized protein C2orf78-like n=1 Tax=Ochotona princeps TaxID=9978 RepID=UPI002714C4A7|nr:uncharacterized protein C2orf78-like [Ochotona princeps]
MAAQIPSQGHGLSLPYLQASQIHDHHQATVGSLLSAQPGPCLQTYGPVTHTATVASAPYPEMVMVLRQIQPTHDTPPVSTSASYYSGSSQPITGTTFQVMESSLGTQTSQGVQPSRQTLCVPQTAEASRSCRSKMIRLVDTDLPPELGHISNRAPTHSPTQFWTLPPGLSKEQTDNANLPETETQLPQPLHTVQSPGQIQVPPLLPWEIPDSHHLLACSDASPSQEQQPGPTIADLPNSSPTRDGQHRSEGDTPASNGFADIPALPLKNICLPRIFSPLIDPDQPKGEMEMNATEPAATKADEVQDSITDIQAPSTQHSRKNKHKATEPLHSAPRAKIPPKTPEHLIEEGEVVDCSNEASHSSPVKEAQQASNKPQKPASSRSRTTKSQRQVKDTTNKGHNTKRPEHSKHSGDKGKAQDKPPIPKTSRKRNPPALPQETFQKPRSRLGMHMMESVQVFHALGKKTEKKMGHSPTRMLASSSHNKDPRKSSATKPWLKTAQEGKGPEKAPAKDQNLDDDVEKGHTSPSVYELPPPGKVKLIPLPFPTTVERQRPRPRPRPVQQKPQSLSSHKPIGATHDHAQPESTNPAQQTAVTPAPPTAAGASPVASVTPAQPTSTNATRPALRNPPQPTIPPSVVSRPVPHHTASYTSVKPQPSSTALPKPPPMPQNPFLIHDFSQQPRPWRKPEMIGPLVSTPITAEQRPEREAMKRRAQLEREEAAKYTSCGKFQYFIEREKEMDISLYYGYVTKSCFES